MSNKLIYYVYAYLRSKDSETAKAGTPYYIGKGVARRAFEQHSKRQNSSTPKDKTQIIFLETKLSELGALALERRLIRWWGRKDLGTGILRNRTDGGEGTSGRIVTDKMREAKPTAGKTMSEETKDKIREARKKQVIVHSEETRKKMSDIQKGRPSHLKGKPGKSHSEETKQKLRKLNLGKKQSAETLQKKADAAARRKLLAI